VPAAAAPTSRALADRDAADALSPQQITALRLTFWGTAVAGLAALGLEVMWARAISIASGTSIYSFAVMLIAFLAGIAIGSWLHAVLPLRRAPVPVQFAVALIGAGIASVVVSQWIPRLPEAALRWNLQFYGNGPAIGTKTALRMAFAIMLVPCIFMGLAFPLAGQASARLARNFGRSIGDTVAVNTGAAILGSLLAGFVLIPTLGLQRGMLVLSALYIAYGCVVLWFAGGSRPPLLRWGARGLALAGLVAACLIPARARPWDLQTLGTFRNAALRSYVDLQGRSVLRGELDRAHVLYYAEGRGSTVSAVEVDERRSFVVNGKAEAGDVTSDLHHELLLGHLPVLLHPEPKSAVVIGLGAGITLGGVAAHPSIQRIDLVEIEPAVRGVAELFSDLHDDALRDPRVHMHIQDGRNFLLTTRAQYDVITSDPIHPWAQGAAYLYTAEYYRTIAARLNPGGIVCQWFPLYDFSEDNIRAVAATFVQNFPYTTLWHTTFDAILIGSNAPIQVDAAALARRLGEPRVARQLGRVGLDAPLSLLAEFTMDDATLRRFASGGIISTDDNLYLEFSSPHSMLTYNWLANLPRVQALRGSPLTVVSNAAALDPDVGALQRRAAAYARAKSETIAAAVAIHAGNMRDTEAAARRLRDIARALPDYGLPRRFSTQAWGRVARERLRAGNPDSALAAARAGLELCPDDPEAHRMAGFALAAQGRQPDAVQEYRESLRLRPRHVATRTALETALVGLGQDAEVVAVLRAGHELCPQSSELATRLAWRLATLPDDRVRNGQEALQLASAAWSLPTPPARRATTLAALAAAQAETGRFADATATANKALALAQRYDQEVTARFVRACLVAFETGRPFRHGVQRTPGASTAAPTSP
jgi:spermidine synthase